MNAAVHQRRWPAILVLAAAVSAVVGTAVGEWPLGVAGAALFLVFAAFVEPAFPAKNYPLVMGAMWVVIGVGGFARYGRWLGALQIGLGAACVAAWDYERRRGNRPATEESA
jgi:hypothetical protein